MNKSTNKKFELVFYHFHNYKILKNNKIECGIYRLDKNDIKFLYKPYTQELDTITKKLNLIDSKNDYNGIVNKKKFHWKDPLRVLKRYIKNTYNIFDIKKLLGEK
jgi:hypothetical protein